MADWLDEGHRKLDKAGMGFTGPQAASGNPPRLARSFLDSIQVELRVIDAIAAATDTTIFGERFATPIMVAALSRLDAIRPNGMAETARGASMAGALMWAGVGGEDELRAMVDTGARVVKIVKPYADIDLIYQKIANAESSGAFAVGMDVCFGFGTKQGYMPAPMSPKTLEEIAGFVKSSRLPFVLKGILSVHDAEKALAAGAAGLMVSNHGGALLDYAIPAYRVLPEIADATAGKTIVFADGGIARGLDAFKALALGARAVGVGRAVMAGLAADGAEGVKRVIEEITAELRRAMSLTGAPDIDGIDRGVLWM